MNSSFLFCFLFIGFVFSQQSTVSFENRASETMRVFWRDGKGGNMLIDNIQAGVKLTLQSFVTHEFFVKPVRSDKEIAQFVVSKEKQDFVIKDVLEAYQSTYDPAVYVSEVFLEVSAPKASEWALIKKWNEVHRKYEMDRLGNERRREQLNRDQPRVVPTYTDVGFALTKVPDDLWKQIRAFWAKNKDKAVSENWDKGNSYVNHWEIQPTMAYLPQSLKDATFDAIKPMLEEWAGVSLVPTACYGIRLYHRGNRLENHVDRLDTHAISAIINVDQDIDEPWALEIMDHNDTMHKIYIDPQDMVLYESASRIHGRPSPFKGNFYANMFVHYRPEKWIDVQV